jgi:hypothetical protein
MLVLLAFPLGQLPPPLLCVDQEWVTYLPIKIVFYVILVINQSDVSCLLVPEIWLFWRQKSGKTQKYIFRSILVILVAAGIINRRREKKL